MSVPTPVTNSAIVIDSGSTSKAASTSRPPIGTHSNSVETYQRPPRPPAPPSVAASRPSSPTKVIAVNRNDSALAVVASQPAPGSPRRGPATRSTANPARGSAGMSHANSTIASVPGLSP